MENTSVNPLHVKNQADHWSMDQTLEYYYKNKVNESFKNLGNRIDQ